MNALQHLDCEQNRRSEGRGEHKVRGVHPLACVRQQERIGAEVKSPGSTGRYGAFHGHPALAYAIRVPGSAFSTS